MRTLITYPVGLLLKIYLAYAKALIVLKERKERKESVKQSKEEKLQTA